LLVLACTLLAALALPAGAAAEPGAQASIINGRPASIEEFPSLVYIQASEGRGGFSCTGSVVAPRVVLTAAHCVESVEEGILTPATRYAVATGVADPSQAQPQNVSRIAATHVFPGFDPGILRGDAAILILSTPTSAPPIPLAGPADAFLYAGGAEVRLAGWGLMRPNARETPANLQSTTMLLQSPSACRQKTRGLPYPYSTAAQICLLAANRASGGCFGDSGGPAIGTRADGTPVQLGITSTGGPSCSTQLPNVLTRVDYVAGWVSEWIAATESGAPPPTLAPGLPLPTMTKPTAEQFTIDTLLQAFGEDQIARAPEISGECRRVSRSRFRCQISWVSGRNIYAGNISPFYLRRQDAVAWDSHFRIEWAPLKCIRNSADNRRCPIRSKRG
jgi:secreted trypsin-like serine protease